jgi:hypothetical protein|nr:MAG TPA: hypothetical protein [Caudoviricetes sp.]
MERLTNKREADAQREEYERRLANGYPRNIPEERFLRLAAYEDTRLMPEEVLPKDKADEIALKLMHLADLESLCSYTRLRELAEADKAGRVVVLPCKVGDTVYWVHGAVITECKVHRIQKNRNGLYICLKSKKSHGAFRTDLCFGKSIFLTREEAEKALEAKSND